MKTKLTLLAILFLVFTISVEARGRNRYSDRHSSNRYERTRFEYHYIPNLTSKQRHRIEQICLDREKKIYKLEARKQEYRRELNMMERLRHASRRDIDNMRRRILNIEKDIDKVRYSAESKIYSLLSHNQKVVYASVNGKNRRY